VNTVSIVEGVLLLVAAATAVVTVLWLIPLIARARVGDEAMAVRNKVMDAVLDGCIDADDPALHDFLDYTHAFSEHAGRLGFSEAWCAHKALVKSGMKPSEFREPVTYARMNEAGRRVMHEAERELNQAVGDYLFDGSRFWFILVPLRHVGRWRARTKVGSSVERFRPTALASDIRQASTSPQLRPLVAMPQTGG
jgi:hypothetical protein